jgi:hypothetical protein
VRDNPIEKSEKNTGLPAKDSPTIARNFSFSLMND